MTKAKAGAEKSFGLTKDWEKQVLSLNEITKLFFKNTPHIDKFTAVTV